jgi:hypothetical protein
VIQPDCFPFLLCLQLVQNTASEAACELLGMTQAALGAALTRKRIITPSEVITKVWLAVRPYLMPLGWSVMRCLMLLH